jgi:hypothetical protein
VGFGRRVMLAAVCAAAIAAVWLAVAQPSAVPLLGGQSPDPDLGVVLLDSRDVPPGFELDATQSGPNEGSPAVPRWFSPLAKYVHFRGYDRVWINRQDRRKITTLVRDYRIDKLASANVYSAEQDFKGDAEHEFSIAVVPDAHGFVGKYGGADAAVGMFAQGSLSFAVAVISHTTASDADIELTRRLMMIQAAKAPPGSTELQNITEPWLMAGTALGVLGAATAYIGSLSLVAWLRDPLRRHPTRSASQTTALPHTTTVDVSGVARRRRRRARARLVAKFSGSAMMVAGILPATWPLGLLLVVLGVGVAWIPRLVTGTTRRVASEPMWWTGRRRFRVSCYRAISTICVLTGLLALVLYGVGTVLTSPGYDYNIRFVVAGVAFLVVGTLIRQHARRLAAFDAKEVLRRDPRPMVVYLRTFADDSLTIRAATYARPSFLDQLSPRRFDRFEEVLVTNLTPIGPVVALNPPGINLAPIGAARETLSAGDHWRMTITEWMANARLIVVGAAPGTMSPGFEWELRAIDSHGLWWKTLLVLPPVPEIAMRPRWERFTAVFTDTAMAHHPITADPARTLAFFGSVTTGWSAITANQRTEWTYAEALATATTILGQERQPQA